MKSQTSTDAKPLTHLDKEGAARMVDVGAKTDTARHAVAQGRVTMSRDTLAAILAGNLKKGDVLSAARLAGIMAAKKTADLIPLCHPLALNKVDVAIDADKDEPGLLVTASVSVTGKTGVEMEALTAVSVACLTIYDMAKALQKDMMIGPIVLREKTGGASGDYWRDG